MSIPLPPVGGARLDTSEARVLGAGMTSARARAILLRETAPAQFGSPLHPEIRAAITANKWAPGYPDIVGHFTAESIRQWQPPPGEGRPTTEDVVEYVAQLAHTAYGADEIRDEIRTMRSRLIWNSVPKIVSAVAAEDSGTAWAAVCEMMALVGPPSKAWPEPLDVANPMPAEPEGHSEWLPRPMQAFVRTESRNMGGSPAAIAVGLLVAFLAAIGRKLGIHPERHTGWVVVPVVWGSIVANASARKSSCYRPGLRQLERLEDQAREGHPDAVLKYRADKAVALGKKKAAEKVLRGPGAADMPEDELRRLGEDVAAWEDLEANPPHPRTLVVTDGTPAAIHEKFCHEVNADGISLWRDELQGIYEMMGAGGNDGARQFYIESWSGMNRHTMLRIGRGELRSLPTALWIMGTTQPGVARTHYAAALTESAEADGWIQRFQLVVLLDKELLPHVDVAPDRGAYREMAAAFDRVGAMTHLDVEGAEQIPGKIPFLRFTPEAQELWGEWYPAMRQDAFDQEIPALESHRAKFASLIPSLALGIHMGESHGGRIPKDALERAIALGEFFWQHAQRLYALGAEETESATRDLADRIRRGRLSDGFTLTDVEALKVPSLAKSADRRAALDALVDAGWIRVEKVQTAGRPATRHRINPRLKLQGCPPPEKGEEARKSPPEAPECKASVQEPDFLDDYLTTTEAAR